MKRRVSLSAAEARRAALAAQGFGHPRPSIAPDRRHFDRVFRYTQLLQLDFVNVLVPAHYLVVWSRLGPYDRDAFDNFIHRSGRFTEQWAHEACIVPVGFWPLLADRRARWTPWKRNPLQQLPQADAYLASVLDQVRQNGSLTANELPQVPGPGRKPGDWHRSIPRWALEHHFGKGTLAVRRRQTNFQRVYDLPERIIPREDFAQQLDTTEAHRELLARAARSCGVATLHDLADYFRMSARNVAPRIEELAEDGVLVPVAVEGWQTSAWIHRDLSIPRRIEGASLLSPFDPVTWSRPRTERLFDFHYRIEIYVPAHRRKWGYYVLPFRLGDEIVARVDLKADRAGGTLLIRQAHLETGANRDLTAAALAAELLALAAWLRLDHLSVQRQTAFSRALRRAIQRQS